MIVHRAKAGSAAVDIAPGSEARLRLRPTLHVEETIRAAPASVVVAFPVVESDAAANALARAYAARDIAIEDAACLREQLRNTQAYLAHVLETERASLLCELALLDGELRARD